ncbi:MAG: hypothetical protein CVT79_04995 [Alphaproteobacteria bacterium HGW-Alphaproteobacteria-18]|nr:MAG: hypothetical protein CVT79_04995 [Alphaproteobacteria bacterium HGW-Alphaproteobacteria-18]
MPLSGVMNFRQMGGLKGQNGRRIRPGLFWRSAGLDQPHLQDIDQIKSLNLKTIVDLRGDRERAAFPTHPSLTQLCDVIWSPPEAENSQAEALMLLSKSSDDVTLIGAIASLYTRIADQHAAHVRMVFDAIASDRVPILVHCAAGKDRTGVVVAIVLEALGVDRRDIMSSYLETNDHLDWDRLSIAATAGTGVKESGLDLTTPPALALLKRAHPQFLEAAFSNIETSYGSIDIYLEQKAGVSSATIKRVRENLLE